MEKNHLHIATRSNFGGYWTQATESAIHYSIAPRDVLNVLNTVLTEE